MKRTRYEVAQNPNDKLWYVIGFCGADKWMPVSSGYSTRDAARAQITHQKRADKSALQELNGL